MPTMRKEVDRRHALSGVTAVVAGKRHDLKCWPAFFQAMLDGEKTFDYRKNDRDFNEGDTVVQHEYNPLSKAYTGRWFKATISYIVKEAPGLPEGYCIMQLKDLR
jgi:hypothetical protein